MLRILTLAIFIALSACAPLPHTPKPVCTGEGQSTLFEVPGYHVRIFGPNTLDRPNIWQGPICITRLADTQVCEKDYSLIKDVAIGSDGKLLDLTEFSGSESTRRRVVIDACE